VFMLAGEPKRTPMETQPLRIGGFLPQTLSDFEGKLAAVIFLQGCNFRCGYCHNPELLSTKESAAAPYHAESILNQLEERARWLDALVVTGGEPLLQLGLAEFLLKVKQRTSLLIKMDTNGSYPKRLQYLLEHQLVDYVALDVKHCLGCQGYADLVGKKFDRNLSTKVAESLRLLQTGEVPHEVRMTLIQEIHTPETVRQMIEQCGPASKIYLQPFDPEHALAIGFRWFHPLQKQELQPVLDQLEADYQVFWRE